MNHKFSMLRETSRLRETSLFLLGGGGGRGKEGIDKVINVSPLDPFVRNIFHGSHKCSIIERRLVFDENTSLQKILGVI